MKFAIYGFLLLVFLIVIMQLNKLFNVNDDLVQKYATSKTRKKYQEKENQRKILESGKNLKSAINSASSSVNQKIIDADRHEMIKFSKRYFDQVGRNYRIYFMKDDRMVYLHRMWFDQNSRPARLIKRDFPSVFEKAGCCFTAEPDFFMVIPGTNIFKEIGHYKFER